MAFDCNSNQRKPLLFSDLFKNHRNTAAEKEQQPATMIAASSSSPSSSSTQFLSSWDSSSSSGFSTPLRSDFGSSEGDDADFIADLTRQMAECMLDDDENTAVHEACGYENPGTELHSTSVRADDPTQPSVQVYELKNQPPAIKERSARGRRVRRSESAQQKQLQKTEQQFKQYRGTEWGGVGISGYSGSGMQAVFLGGSGPRIGSNGTGVFLPRDPTELKNKSGCSMVLMPTRVLQVLEKHYSRIQQDSSAPPPTGGPHRDDDESTVADDDESSVESTAEMQLPQEWTY